LGVRLAIDDFGTGYSSFSYLRRFPVDTVKIDQSFVRALGQGRGSSAIVEAIARVAHALDMDVTAEGIESQVQLDLASEYRCDRGQGYLFSEPLPVRAATEIIRDGGASWIPRLLPAQEPPRLKLIG
jgi:EAL domain-containing protein (putative c-di-GMP-specific phosphodiesterase class I)